MGNQLYSMSNDPKIVRVHMGKHKILYEDQSNTTDTVLFEYKLQIQNGISGVEWR